MEILNALSAGADMALIAIAGALWRVDRRILSIELFLKHKLKYGD